MKKKKFEWGYLLLLPGLGYMAAFILLSFVFMVLQSVGMINYTGESVFTTQYWSTFADKMFTDSLLFTIKVAVLSSLISIVICYPLAMLLQKTWGSKLLLSIIKMPLFIPALVGSFLIINLIDYHGLLNQLLMWMGVISEPLRMRNDPYGIGVIAIQVWKNVPYQLILMYSALEAIRKDVKDAARNLGAGPISLFKNIILPLSLPNALVAVILVFVKVFNDFAVSSTAGPTYPYSLANLMYTKAYTFQEWGVSACIGVVMMIVSVLFVTVYTIIGKKLEKIM